MNKINRTIESLSALLKDGNKKQLLDAIIDLYTSTDDLKAYEPFGVELASHMKKYFVNGDYETFIYLSDSSSKLLNVIGTTLTIQNTYELQSIKYYIFDDHQKGLEVMNKFYYFALVNNLTDIIDVVFGNLTTLQLNLKDYKTAYKSLTDWQLSLADSPKISEYNWHYNINMARYYLETNNTDLALPHLTNTINDKQTDYITSNKIEAYSLMGLYHEKKNEPTTSLTWYNKAVELLESHNQTLNERSIYKHIADVYFQLEDYKSSAAYRNKYIDVVEQVLRNYKNLLKTNTELEVYLRHKELEAENLLEMNKDFAHQKNTDYLTGIYNRRYITDLIKDRFDHNRSKVQPLSLLLFDIDHFKEVNDTFGHLAGDEVLSQISHLINNHLSNKHIFGRYGGDEFIIVYEDLSLGEAFKISDKLRSIVAKHTFFVSNQQMSITISGGLSSSKELDNQNSQKLYDLADRRLYKAKEIGRNIISLD